ncbi:hypothetical protein [Leptolinea tardivitalis]|uniref:Glycosyltransferase RgtA/B/C/D-like domain-containing protein n=1 Tax=Leptolinea tardivitalis TaxID=229920 RepID=A0A0N8GLI0_9CHLR|nr:hypothetical protein [Leptolinea tardivitalis]KPL72554.1 hypothetical protein ADM99_05390 [Leptolinea tardivitalis]GAP21145.1 hypothetical protein LTAR_01352 [Leptolinea tardivitalis]
MKNRYRSFFIAALLVVSALPDIIGCIRSVSELSYSGLVFNPIDGYSYLAKMQIGKSGEWLFTLPFTANPGEGRLLFPFYIASGHIFGWLGIPLSVGFVVLRLLCFGLLILSLIRLSEKVFNDNFSLIFLVLTAGGGLGWLLLPTGNFGADFWVAEAFPFLSGLANPHFPLALCLMVFTILLFSDSNQAAKYPGIMFCGFFLSILSPFGFFVSCGVLSISWLWERINGRQSVIWPLLIFLFSGIPYAAYQYWAVNSTPEFAAWTAQNQTPSPAVWDVALTFSPWIVLIVLGWRGIWAQNENPIIRKLIIWMVVGLVLTVIPFNLQRRFLIGLYIPIACLGFLGLDRAASTIKIQARKLAVICTALSLITPFLLVVMTSSVIASHNPLYYFQPGEVSAIQWLSKQDGGRDLVLADGQTGSLIPAISRLRVLYGHPFETIDAENKKDQVEDFFSGKMTRDEEEKYLKENSIKWIFYGSREQNLGKPDILKDKNPIKQFENVSIFSVTELVR